MGELPEDSVDWYIDFIKDGGFEFKGRTLTTEEREIVVKVLEGVKWSIREERSYD